jgi:hypothetical protein
LCHQLSKGALVIITNVPQMVTHAPSGPRNPQKRTLSARDSVVPRKVVCSTSHPQLTPASTAPNCSRRCGSVQKVSRPTVSCHEMSHNKPTTIHVDEQSTAYNGHVRADVRCAALVIVLAARTGAAMLPMWLLT